MMKKTILFLTFVLAAVTFVASPTVFADLPRTVRCPDGTDIRVDTSSTQSNEEACAAAGHGPIYDTQYYCGYDSQNQKIPTSIDFGDLCKDKNASPITALLLWVINFMSVGVGIAVVIGIVIGGLVYAQSDGNANGAQQGKSIIINSIVGLFLFIFLYAAVQFFVPGGVFHQ